MRLHYASPMNMNFIPVREMAARPGAVMRRVKKQGFAVATTNGKPSMVMFPVGEENFTERVFLILGQFAKEGMRRSQQRAVADGRSNMPLAEINEIIAEARASRRRRRK